jgi:uncharacterized protein YoxC
MIEKLDRHIKTEENGVRISCPPTHADCIDKINELVDAVNKQEEQIKLLIDALERLAKSQQEMNTEITALFIK